METSKTQGWKWTLRSVERSHLYGLSLQHVEAAALIKSADGLPDHVDALEAL